MAIKLKTKVALGGIFLFALLIVVGTVSFFYFNRLSEDSKEIVKDNYETLNYSRDMLKELDAFNSNDSTAAFNAFEINLQLQEKNITEPGEEELTVSLRKNFNELRQKVRVDALPALIRQDIIGIMQANLKAIDKKNQAVQTSAQRAKTIITFCLTVCLLLGFTFLFNFPSLVASPIASLTEGIKAIANKNYGERIHLNRKDEFGDLANAFNTMAERLDEYEHSNLSKIMFEKQRAETVINSLKDASIGIDNKGIVLFANQQALHLLNLKETEIISLSQEEVKKRNDLFQFLINEQNSIPFKIVVEGKENYFTKEIIELTHDKQKAGHVIVLKNITPFKELDVAKTNFIATISHELKTPLASSDFSLKLLEDERVGTLTSEQKELVQSLKDDNKRLLRILSELLDMSQVESGKIQLTLQAVQSWGLIDKALASVLNAAKQKNISIQKKVAEDIPAVKADADKTTWVLNNLLTNAIRYSADNTEIIIGVQRQGNNVQFTVQDFGKGIDPQYKDKIFDRYFKIPGTKEGTGLGLAICKEFIEAQGGTINVDSDFGKGSRFSFTLPVNI
ncbi:MAG: HAMP domain-containing protein [Chitinophagaceae bacterium]|jgi:signal transduction histidine kinase|nr:HAMP domain-containing protein [Chitinophagaceae bacterium]MBK9466013.1 HAMP domain-containing protein [Chitinophagaceae bacterium]MBK9661406.1 HAMP domain-containing protein [Chitinophagaceae bacterium]MBK9937535.1 HAMP domain-containing protein [Chitinophagaceae bacterium]MBL0069295.1 HAMP domain-containing protein [Chitinophagaceae bacterium]